ncbi:MAG: DUF4167 domain-containing protein [Alphaproteobacteria bacterium]|nr:MAG: DUF4167 domain-containing protein [Alphaproteobacteria bacterium]
MRSPKSRSRSKSNRNRSMGNIVNRVFESSGPEGKVRGTPQQIIEKYNQLARDAQLANDRVAMENFQQHAEHYMRLLGEALREQEARREAQEAQARERREARQGRSAPSEPAVSEPESGIPEVIDLAEEEVGGLVETPEAAAAEPAPEAEPAPAEQQPRKAARPRRRSARQPRAAKTDETAGGESVQPADDKPTAAE